MRSFALTWMDLQILSQGSTPEKEQDIILTARVNANHMGAWAKKEPDENPAVFQERIMEIF